MGHWILYNLYFMRWFYVSYCTSTNISRYFYKENPSDKNQEIHVSFLKVLSFEKGISSQQVMLWTQGLREHQWVHFRHFCHLSLAIRHFPPKPLRSKITNKYFQDLPSYRGSYVLRGERQEKIEFSRFDVLKVLLFQQKKGHPFTYFQWQNK